MDENNIKLQEAACNLVYSTGRWYKFFGVLYIITIVFLALLGLMMLIFGQKINEFGGGQELLFPSAIMGIIYIVMAGMIVPLTVYILRGAREAKAAAMQGDNDLALRFLEASKKFREYYGIITIILFIISLLLIPAAMIASLMTV